jgi:hypothetical protein
VLVGLNSEKRSTVNKIYSKAEPERLLHVIFNTNEPFENRIDLSDGKEWLQVSVMNIPPAKKVNPHIHKPRAAAAGAGITQECWIVLRGEIRARLFDLDQTLLHEQALSQGHMLVTFYGGHSLECGTDGAMMIECKNGPYLGRDYMAFEQS